MYIHPHALLEIARQRIDDRIRQAEQSRLADSARDGRERTGIVSRLRDLAHVGGSSRRPAVEGCAKRCAPGGSGVGST